MLTLVIVELYSPKNSDLKLDEPVQEIPHLVDGLHHPLQVILGPASSLGPSGSGRHLDELQAEKLL